MKLYWFYVCSHEIYESTKKIIFIFSQFHFIIELFSNMDEIKLGFF